MLNTSVTQVLMILTSRNNNNDVPEKCTVKFDVAYYKTKF